MEAAIRTALVSTFEDYVYGLEKTDTSRFPLILRDLQLKPSKVNEDLEDSPFLIEEGRVGLVKISPGWMGNVEIEASGIKVNLSFSPVKAAKLAMKGNEPEYNTEEIFMTGAHAPRAPPPPVNVPPRYCSQHDTSEKRVKGQARSCACTKCGITFTSTYSEVVLCAACSEKEKRCLICGASAGKAGSYIPSASGNGGGGPADKENCNQLPPPPPGAGRPNQGLADSGSMRTVNPGSPHNTPWKDLYGNSGSNLRPTDSMPVQQGGNRGPPDLRPTGMGVQQDGNRCAPMPASQQASRPMNSQAPMQQRPIPGYRGPPQNMNRGRPPQQQQQDDNPFSGFLRTMNCAIAGMFDQEEDEPVRQGRPPMHR